MVRGNTYMVTIELSSRDYKQIDAFAQMSVRTFDQQMLYFIRLGIERERQTDTMRWEMDKAARKELQTRIDADADIT